MITAQRATKAAGKWASLAGLKLRGATGAATPYTCPACGAAVVGFFRYGTNRSWGCPSCGASPRQRLVCWLIDNNALPVPPRASILHIAPNEKALVSRFQTRASDYVPADLHPEVYALPGVVKLDLMALPDRDRFDIIYASHVMEHVEDDGRVLANMFAALKPGGEAWLIVPLWDKPTEDGSYAMPPRERERRFGQWDHVRQYGMDFADRIRAVGFAVDLVDARPLDAQTGGRHALDDILFRARKPG